ncbi:MAG: tetratricopeptide repeat protein [Gemmatimonadetes bacterium]|nr:tetratricopeptide repeat protein [Gemmatimonadota bacterium]
MNKTNDPFQRPRSRRILSAFCVAALVGGCHEATHQTQRHQAEQRWNQVRSQVKFQLASQQFERGFLDEALGSLSEAVQLDPGNASCHLLAAKCHLERGDIASAERSAKHAEAGGVSAESAYARGLIAERRERLDEALDYFRQAMALDPTHADSLVAAVEALVVLDEPEEARGLLDEHINEFDRDGRLSLLRADISILLGDFDEAAVDLADASSRMDAAPWVSEQYGLILVRAGRYADALSVLKPLVESYAAAFTGPNPNRKGGDSTPSPAVVRAVATCYNHLGAAKAARQLLDEHLAQDPDDARAWWVAAESAIELEDWRGALRYADRGERLAPVLPHWKLIRAFCAWRQDDPATATKLLDSILATHPDQAVAHLMLSEIQRECGDDAER